MKTFRQTIQEISANDKLDKLGNKPLSGSHLKQLTKGYPTFKDIDLDQWQGYPPPSNSSQITKNEIHNLISLGQNRDQWERDMVMHDKKIMQAFKEYLDEYGLEVDLNRIKKIKDQTHPILLSLKRYYNRPRPQVLAKKLGLDLSFFSLKTAETPSYPSGHATLGRLVAKLIADEAPLEHRRNILDIGERIGYSRQVAGAHYASDTEFGHRLGDELYRLASTRQEPELTLEKLESEIIVKNFKEYINEDKPAPLMEGTTSASTYFEQVIVACANAKNLEAVKTASGYAAWLAEAGKDKKWKTDDKTLEKFRKQIRKIATSGSQSGQSYEKTSALWKTVTGKSSDTSKADIKLGNHKVSVKGPDARLMSGVKEESLATLYAAFETIDVKDLGLGLEQILKDFVSKVKTEGAEFNSRTLKQQDPKTLSAANKKAFKNLQTQMDVKKLAEAAFKKAFASGQGKFAQAFAWEAMSGEKKFASKGVANAMLIWPYNLRSVIFHPNLSLNDSYVSGVAKQMKFSADVKSNSNKKSVGGVKTKTGYTISQTVGLAMKTAASEFDDAQNDSKDESLHLENMLIEGKIDEGKFTDMIKGVWQRLKNTIKAAWKKLVNIISGLLSDLKNAIKGGMNHLLWHFEFEPVVRVKTTGIRW